MAVADVIILNGKRYDAITGRFLGTVESSKTELSVSQSKITPVKASRQTASEPAISHHFIHIRTSTDASEKQDPSQGHKSDVTHISVRRGTPLSAPPHQPQRSKTLMRQGVNPPSPSLKKYAKVQTPAISATKQLQIDVKPKLFIAEIDEDRLKRSRKVTRNSLVKHFDVSGKLVLQNNVQRAVNHTKVPPTVTSTYSPKTPPAPSHTQIDIQRKQRSQEIFDRALANATSHKQMPHSVKRHSGKHTHSHNILKLSAASFVILLIIGFITYQNASSIQIRLASTRAGINATLPRWRPAGFSIGSFSYKPGAVSISFNDPVDMRSFTLTQSSSGWDATSLLNDFVVPNNETFQTIQSKNTTIYTYGENNATWINGGIWYKLTSNGSLSTSELAKLADSI